MEEAHGMLSGVQFLSSGGGHMDVGIIITLKTVL